MDSHQAPMMNPSQQPEEVSSIGDILNVQNLKPEFPDIIDMIKRTCTKIMMEKIHKINDVVSKRTPRPFITLQHGGIQSTWLFDTGAAISCMSLKAFRTIPIKHRPKKIGEGCGAKGATGSSLIPVGQYLMPIRWNGKSVMQPMVVFQHLNTPLILGIDGINNLGITYLSIPDEFVFQSECTQSQFKKADLMTVATVKIPALSTVPVRLGTAIGRRHTPMAAGFKAVSTIGNPDFPALFAQPGLVVPDHRAPSPGHVDSSQ